MKKTLHKSESRGHANHGWLDTHHTFSFAGYQDPNRVNFGSLRVLNDDIVAGGQGFGTHSHQNMEIISIPLKGDLEHKDSMGNTMVIKENDVQVMSAGTGVNHSEYNKNSDKSVNFLQLWIFPNQKDVEPRYDQKTFLPEDRLNKLQPILAPNQDKVLWIHSDTWMFRSDLKAGNSLDYGLNKKGNGLYIFVVDGNIRVDGEQLLKRDGIALNDLSSIEIRATEDSSLIIMEIPMNTGIYS